MADIYCAGSLTPEIHRSRLHRKLVSSWMGLSLS